MQKKKKVVFGSKEQPRDYPTVLEKLGDIFIISILMLVLGFLATHQSLDTGFFTDKFGLTEQIFLYVPLVFAGVPSVMRLLGVKLQPTRVIEAGIELLQGAATLYLLIVFPFDYAYFANVDNDALESLLSLVTNDIARVMMVLEIISSPFQAGGHLYQFFTHAKDEAKIKNTESQDPLEAGIY